MKVTPAVLLALVVSCGTMDPGNDPASLILETGTESFTGPADRPPYNHSLDDPAGLASIKVEVAEIDQARFFTADDFRDGATPHFLVPDDGWISVIVRLTQDGEVVADGKARWMLGPDVQWKLDIDRGWDPLHGAVYHLGFERHLQEVRDGYPVPPGGAVLPCEAFYCDRTWRVPISGAGANYPEEALWLTLWRSHPDECVDLCVEG